MGNATSVTSAVSEQIFDAVETGQKAVIEGVQTWAEIVKKFVPEMPASFPVAGLPTPTELVDKGFAVTERWMAMQKDFARGIAAAVMPSTPVAPSAKSEK